MVERFHDINLENETDRGADMRQLIIGLLAAVSIASASHAQVIMGTNPYGGICMGVYCGNTQPAPNSGYNSNGGACFGANCYGRQQDDYQSYRPREEYRPTPGPCDIRQWHCEGL